VIPHEKDWIKHSDKVKSADTICAKNWNSDEIQTAVFNSVEWEI
jgi:hypothetical protein